MTVNVPGRRGPQGPSPLEGERIRPLSRWQIEDRLAELGDLYAQTAGGDSRAWNHDRELFLRRLAGEVQRPGFALLVAERSVPGTPAGGESAVLAGCAYGFPVRADGPWWRGLDGYLPRDVLGLAASGRLFAISGLVVHSRVRTHHQGLDWNLARRLQRRLLADHTAGLADRADGTGAVDVADVVDDVGVLGVLGVTLVERDDAMTLRALRSWGWRSVAPDASVARDMLRYAPCRALVLGP
ncbi:hypothetical protein OG616_20545 [Streptomyces antibioticus]|uniref:hypothetical protein n=1 Tax=Streptomyces antibioticus TaxID=1890 RepID=UPI00224F18D4|nr:hypothetical protein [Streptomyces antibioticus]MCX5170385.1 hypothetical protein [Streptomyces antibioticus]